MKAYGYFCLVLGLCITLIALLPAISTMGQVAALFILCALASVPAVVTYSTLGLNGDEDINYQESKRRRALLNAGHPGIFRPVLALVIVYAGLAIALGDIRLFVLFGACCCLLSGYWGIYIFPRAKKLLPPFNEQP
ncbi:hypothetical protein [Cerasicoccus fimbriatus]|uniref:hypothetical protein n=1 Tax=Cerasicoccus fimbriatus TaxID=3014554 RepID=UPI0022B48C46|nr:hypothetical protein [Cerasicoccus sp. TK19100]